MAIKWNFVRCINLLVVLHISPGFADNSTTSLEIEHLLEFVESSGCIFIRNGSEYDSKEAREHITNKYDYTKRWTDNAEEFIEYSATGSSISGTPYRVRCQGQNIPSAQWLLEELENYRTIQLQAGGSAGSSPD